MLDGMPTSAAWTGLGCTGWVVVVYHLISFHSSTVRWTGFDRALTWSSNSLCRFRKPDLSCLLHYREPALAPVWKSTVRHMRCVHSLVPGIAALCSTAGCHDIHFGENVGLDWFTVCVLEGLNVIGVLTRVLVSFLLLRITCAVPVVAMYTVRVLCQWLPCIQYVCCASGCHVCSACAMPVVAMYTVCVLCQWFPCMQCVCYASGCHAYSTCAVPVVAMYTVRVLCHWLSCIQYTGFACGCHLNSMRLVPVVAIGTVHRLCRLLPCMQYVCCASGCHAHSIGSVAMVSM